MLIDSSTVMAFLALVMSGISVGVSLLARRDSNRSADAAEKSAKEAEKSGMINQAGLLAKHFLHVDYIFDAAQGKSTSGRTKESSMEGKQSVKFLKNIIQDPAFHKVLDEIVPLYEERTVSVFVVANSGDGRDKLEAQEARATELRMDYESVKRKCLDASIG